MDIVGMIAGGAVIGGAIYYALTKAPPKVRLQLAAYPVCTDLTAGAIAYLPHVGTGAGAMAAACGGLMFSFLMSSDRAKYGRLEYIKKGKAWICIYVTGTSPFSDLELGFSPMRMTPTEWLERDMPTLLTQEATA